MTQPAEKQSKYRGVTWLGWRKQWRARVKRNGKEYFLGYFDNQLEASHAVEAKIKELDAARAHSVR